MDNSSITNNIPPEMLRAIRSSQQGASSAGAQTQQQRDNRPPAAPPKAAVADNYIPSPESLRTLIDNGVLAMQRGTYWDRGSILNIVV